jgi:hypothetical protein
MPKCGGTVQWSAHHAGAADIRYSGNVISLRARSGRESGCACPIMPGPVTVLVSGLDFQRLITNPEFNAFCPGFLPNQKGNDSTGNDKDADQNMRLF